MNLQEHAGACIERAPGAQRVNLIDLIDPRHELTRLAAAIDWRAFEEAAAPPRQARLMVALLYLQCAYALTGDELVERWKANPHWQHFSGQVHLQCELPCDPSLLVAWLGGDGSAPSEPSPVQQRSHPSPRVRLVRAHGREVGCSSPATAYGPAAL